MREGEAFGFNTAYHRWPLHNSGLLLCHSGFTFVSSGANSHQGQGSGARDGGRDRAAEGQRQVWRRGDAAHDLQPSPRWDSPARLSVGCCIWMLIKYFERLWQLVLSAGWCWRLQAGERWPHHPFAQHLQPMCFFTALCDTAVSSSIVLLWQFFCPPS